MNKLSSTFQIDTNKVTCHFLLFPQPNLALYWCVTLKVMEDNKGQKTAPMFDYFVWFLKTGL